MTCIRRSRFCQFGSSLQVSASSLQLTCRWRFKCLNTVWSGFPRPLRRWRDSNSPTTTLLGKQMSLDAPPLLPWTGVESSMSWCLLCSTFRSMRSLVMGFFWLFTGLGSLLGSGLAAALRGSYLYLYLYTESLGKRTSTLIVCDKYCCVGNHRMCYNWCFGNRVCYKIVVKIADCCSSFGHELPLFTGVWFHHNPSYGLNYDRMDCYYYLLAGILGSSFFFLPWAKSHGDSVDKRRKIMRGVSESRDPPTAFAVGKWDQYTRWYEGEKILYFSSVIEEDSTCNPIWGEVIGHSVSGGGGASGGGGVL